MAVAKDELCEARGAVAGSGRRDYLLDPAGGTVVSSLPVQASAGLPQL